jgi:D-tyrosyl-tRNA(Tyr) deacylase
VRAVVTRVDEASVTAAGEPAGAIGRGLLVLIGVARGDAEADADAIAEKVAGLRIFPDEAGAQNRSVIEAGGAVLAVSQFTLLGDARRGRRPSFIEAADPGLAEALYGRVVARLRERGLEVATGRFRTAMKVSSVNDGPITILIDSKKLF